MALQLRWWKEDDDGTTTAMMEGWWWWDYNYNDEDDGNTTTMTEWWWWWDCNYDDEWMMVMPLQLQWWQWGDYNYDDDNDMMMALQLQLWNVEGRWHYNYDGMRWWWTSVRWRKDDDEVWDGEWMTRWECCLLLLIFSICHLLFSFFSFLFYCCTDNQKWE